MVLELVLALVLRSRCQPQPLPTHGAGAGAGAGAAQPLLATVSHSHRQQHPWPMFENAERKDSKIFQNLQVGDLSFRALKDLGSSRLSFGDLGLRWSRRKEFRPEP